MIARSSDIAEDNSIVPLLEASKGKRTAISSLVVGEVILMIARRHNIGRGRLSTSVRSAQAHG